MRWSNLGALEHTDAADAARMLETFRLLLHVLALRWLRRFRPMSLDHALTVLKIPVGILHCTAVIPIDAYISFDALGTESKRVNGLARSPRKFT
jgi:hypothetical protein